VRSGPSSQQSTTLLGTVLYMMQRYAEAHACFKTAHRLGPFNTMAQFFDASAYVMTGAYDRAEDLLSAMTGTDMLPRVVAMRGYIAAKRGDLAASEKAIETIRAVRIPSDTALCAVHVARGEYASAVAALERAMRTREPGLFLVAIDPMYAALYASHRDLQTTLQRGRPPLCDSCGIEIRGRDDNGTFDCLLCLMCQSSLDLHS
jgi:tetratricopeptide (TPR) repeat protein